MDIKYQKNIMNNKNISYTRIVLKNVFNPTFLLISIGLSVGVLISIGVIFGFYYALQGTGLIMGLALLAILKRGFRKDPNHSYFSKLIEVRSKFEKIKLKLVELSIFYL